MSFFSIFIIIIAVSIDGFISGFAYGFRKINISTASLIGISLWSILFTFISMIFGNILRHRINFTIASYISFSILIFLAIFALIDTIKKKRKKEDTYHTNIVNISFHENTMLGIAVAIDASIAAFSLALLGYSPYILPFFFGLSHLVLVGMGNYLGRSKYLYKINDKLTFMPTILLTFCALLRLI